jgi:hypothetical protein
MARQRQLRRRELPESRLDAQVLAWMPKLTRQPFIPLLPAHPERPFHS